MILSSLPDYSRVLSPSHAVSLLALINIYYFHIQADVVNFFVGALLDLLLVNQLPNRFMIIHIIFAKGESV